MLPSIAYIVISILSRAQRWRVDDPHGVLCRPVSERFVFAFWHNRLALMPHFSRRYLRGRKIAVMVSASHDGSLLTAILEKFGIFAVRGSTSRFGAQALRALAEKVGEGYDAGITPDGPRGPRYHAQQGVAGLAQLADAPIVPLSFRLSWKIQLKSWDGFWVPLPFARCDFRVGHPLTVPPDADDSLREQKIRELEAALREMGGEG